MSVAPLLVPVSPGELIDKITILEIKRERLRDPQRQVFVLRELDLLSAARDRQIKQLAELDRLTRDLRATNERLWDVEDQIRACETVNDFGPRFVELARAVYRENDHRANLKREINMLLGSELVEQKQYRRGE